MTIKVILCGRDLPGAPGITSSNYPVEVQRINFPAGELHIRVSAPEPVFHMFQEYHWRIDWRFQDSSEIVEMMLLVDALRRYEVQGKHVRAISLFMPYLPFARQDRVAVKGDSLSIAAFGRFMESLDFLDVEIWDPHSDAAEMALAEENLKVVRQHELLGGFPYAWPFYTPAGVPRQEFGLICPDQGARKKIEKAAEALGVGENMIVYADKRRDPVTGRLEGTIRVPSRLFQTPLLIVDDLADRGGTFKNIANQVKEQGHEAELMLYVTHGVLPDEAAKEICESGISRIFCPNLLSRNTRGWANGVFNPSVYDLDPPQLAV